MDSDSGTGRHISIITSNIALICTSLVVHNIRGFADNEVVSYINRRRQLPYVWKCSLFPFVGRKVKFKMMVTIPDTGRIGCLSRDEIRLISNQLCLT